MALDKAIAHGKEKRKPYKGGKAVDYSCRNHGSCDYCKGNRLYNTQKKLEAAADELQLNCNQIATKLQLKTEVRKNEVPKEACCDRCLQAWR